MLKSLAYSASALAAAYGAAAAVQNEAPPTREAALAAWASVYEVFSHPRCANCHVADDRPRWSGPSYGLEPGDWRYHGMYVHAGESRIGAETVMCSACHSSENADVPHGPPGNDVWLLPPPEMVWFEKSSAEICAQIKDPARNGGRTLAEVADHVGHDSLVLWGWEPGPGREPAPGSPGETVAALEAWAAGGAPCPGGSAD